MRRVEASIQLKPDERIELVIREYGIMLVPALASTGLVYFALLFLMYAAFSRGPIILALWFVGLVLVICFFLRKWWLWYYEAVIVTNRRCVDIQRSGVFSKMVKELPWSGVDDIQFSQRGALATVLHYGSVVIVSTTGDRIELQHIYQPEKVRDILAQYVEKLC